jgi:ATP-dependent protease HslVU (ClpYQ) peptidase subunit
MTTIVANKEEVAGDLQFTNISAAMKFKGKTKVFKFQPHEYIYPECEYIVGFAGTASDLITVADYFENPERQDKPPRVRNLSGLVLTERGDLFYFDEYSKWIKVHEPFYAIGSGAHVALGVMEAGGSPKEAIKAASKHDPFTGMGVKSLRFD